METVNGIILLATIVKIIGLLILVPVAIWFTARNIREIKDIRGETDKLRYPPYGRPPVKQRPSREKEKKGKGLE